MKKLLALILCVMLFVSVIPMGAFAAEAGTAQSGWADKANNKKAAKAARDAIEAMYTALAVDQTVFNSAKAMYDFSDGLAKSLFANTEKATSADGKVTKYQEDLITNTRKYLNSIIGGAINKTLADKKDVYTDSNDNIDAAKYMKVYAEAASKALGSEKAQKGIEAIALAIMAAGVRADMKDRLEDLDLDIADWGDSKFEEFGFKAPTPWSNPVWLDATAPADLANAADLAFLFNS